LLIPECFQFSLEFFIADPGFFRFNGIDMIILFGISEFLAKKFQFFFPDFDLIKITELPVFSLFLVLFDGCG